MAEMTRTLLFQIHWFLGITAGFVLAVMGVSGAALGFAPEVISALNPGITTVAPQPGPRLSGPDLAARLTAQHPDARIVRLVVSRDPTRAAILSYTAGKATTRHVAYLDPVTGRDLGTPRGEGIVDTIQDLHRWLALPGGGKGIGRQITGFAALALIFFALSGLYLRWPRRPLDWRNWLVLDLRRTGRNLYRALHAVVGGWVLLFYLISAGTGLWWSYDWYRTGLRHLLVAEAPKPGDQKEKGGKDAPVDWTIAWRGFDHATGARAYETVTATARDGKVEFRAKLPDARHDRVSDEVSIDAASGAAVSVTPYAERGWGQDIVTSIYEIHRGAYFGLPGRLAMMLASLTMPLFTVTGLLLYLARRRRKAALAAVSVTAQPTGTPRDGGTLVAYASQTGAAERIARLTAQALPDAQVLPVADLDTAALRRARRLFVVASTYGEGEPPDGARGFARRLAQAPGDLSHLGYAVLALGDREYPDFCAFGHRIDRWLHDGGAQRLFDPVEMDGDAVDAQRQWQQQLAGLGARTDQPDWVTAPMQDWRLVERRLLNPGSSGGEAWHVALEPAGDAAAWVAGDIIEIEPQHDPRRIDACLHRTGWTDTPGLRALLATRILPGEEGAPPAPDALPPLAHRDYSIASVGASGRVELIVRRCLAAGGLPGLASGWLTQGAPLGGVVRARIRRNPAFHPPADPAVPLILIGNGTGLAGLLAHMRHRVGQSAAGPVDLFWGERHPRQDDYHRAERAALIAAHADSAAFAAWSRLGAGPRYVQDAVTAQAARIAAAVADGASIYVCGSVQGMASGVHHALLAILGEDVLEAMLESGRYRRDIY